MSGSNQTTAHRRKRGEPRGRETEQKAQETNKEEQGKTWLKEAFYLAWSPSANGVADPNLARHLLPLLCTLLPHLSSACYCFARRVSPLLCVVPSSHTPTNYLTPPPTELLLYYHYSPHPSSSKSATDQLIQSLYPLLSTLNRKHLFKMFSGTKGPGDVEALDGMFSRIHSTSSLPFFHQLATHNGRIYPNKVSFQVPTSVFSSCTPAGTLP